MKKLKKFFKLILLSIGCFAILFFVSFIVRKVRVESETQKLNSAHFEVHYTGILEGEAESISTVLEFNYGRIRTELEDPKDGKISVYIHPNQNDFNKNNRLGKQQSERNESWAFGILFKI